MMELDEIKNVWSELNNRLEKSEALNQQLLSELISSKQISAKEKLMKFEVRLLILCLFFFCLSSVHYISGKNPAAFNLLCASVFLLAGAWQIFKIYLLKQIKVDTSTTSDMLKKAIRLKLLSKTRMIVGMILLVPVVILLAVFDPKLLHGPGLIAYGVGIVIGVTTGLMLYFKHMKDIDRLIKSYREINDSETI